MRVWESNKYGLKKKKNRFIDLQILGHFEFLPFLPKNGRVENNYGSCTVTIGHVQYRVETCQPCRVGIYLYFLVSVFCFKVGSWCNRRAAFLQLNSTLSTTLIVSIYYRGGDCNIKKQINIKLHDIENNKT